MKIKKLGHLLLIFILCGSFMLSGCDLLGGPGGTGEKITVDDIPNLAEISKTISGEISIIVPGGNRNETDLVNKVTESFNMIYPNITVNLAYLSLSSYENTIRNLNLTDMLPDIMWTNSPDYLYLTGYEVIQDLTPFIEASERDGLFDFEEDFYTEFFDMASYNGERYAVPRSCDSVITFYNKQILNDAGVDLNTIKDGWTWDDMLAACEKVRTRFDSTGKQLNTVFDMNLTSWLSVNYPILRSYGADVANSEGKIVIDSQATRNCLTMIRNMVDKRYIGGTGVSSASSFDSGTSAFMFQSASVSHYADRRELKDKIDVVSFPLITDNDTPKIGAGIAGYAMKKNMTIDTKILCWLFLNHLLSYDGQQAMATGGIYIPSIRRDLSLANPEANWHQGYSNLNMSAYTYGADYKTDIEFLRYFPPKNKMDLTTSLIDLFDNACNPTKTIEECISTAVRDFDNALAI